MLSAADNVSGRSLWLFWLLVLCVSLTYSWAEIVKGSALESNLMSWIPLSEQTKSGGKAWDELRTASERSFTLLLAAQSPERGLQIAKQLRAKLAAEHMLAAKGAESLLGEVKDFYFPYRAQLLTQSNRQWLIETDQQAIADSLVQQLYSPIRRYRPYSFSSDPFNLAADWQLSLLAG